MKSTVSGMEVSSVKRKNDLFLAAALIIIIAAGSLLFFSRSEPLSFDVAFDKVSAVTVPLGYEEYLSQNPHYHDREISSLADLEKASSLIIRLRVEEIEQIDSFCLLNCRWSQILSGREPADRMIRIVYPNHIQANGYDRKKGRTLDLSQPVSFLVNMPEIIKSGKEYVMFLNRIDGQELWHFSSFLYGAVSPDQQPNYLLIPDMATGRHGLQAKAGSYDYIITDSEILERYRAITEEVHDKYSSESLIIP